MSAAPAPRCTAPVRALAAIHARAMSEARTGGDGASGGGRACVVCIEPPDGARGVLRDDPVVAIVSHPLDPASLTPGAFLVAGPGGPAPGQLRLSADGRVLVWLPERLLDANGEHEVRLTGLRDVRGHDVAPHLSRFVPCRLSARDVRA